MTKEELMKMISERVTDLDLVTELLEGISDLVVEFDDSEFTNQINSLTEENKNLKQKYIDRFTKGNVEKEEDVVTEEKEEKIIDVKELDLKI